MDIYFYSITIYVHRIRICIYKFCSSFYSISSIDGNLFYLLFFVVDPKKPIRIFDESIKRAFIFEEDKERFIEEINSENKLVIETHLNIKLQPGNVLFTENFCYIDMIMPLRKQILRIADIKKASLKIFEHPGSFTNIRDIYGIVLKVRRDGKRDKIIRLLFRDPNEANEIMKKLSPIINRGGEVENEIEFRNTEEGIRALRNEFIKRVIIGIIILTLIYVFRKYLF